MRSPLALIVVGLLLAGSVVISALIVTRGVTYTRLVGLSRLEVTGSAERLIRSDRVRWAANFRTIAPADDLGAGYRRLAADLTAVRRVLAERGFESDAVEVAPVAVYPVYRECYNSEDPDCVRELASYELWQVLTIDSDRVDDVTALAQDAVAFTDAGVQLIPQSLEYFTSRLANLRSELLAEATGDAQERARAIAASTGAEVGPLQAVTSGVFQVTRVNSIDVSSLGEYDTSAIDKKVTAVVRATFVLR